MAVHLLGRTAAPRVKAVRRALCAALLAAAAGLLAATPAAGQSQDPRFERQPRFEQFQRRAVDIAVRIVQPPDREVALEPVIVSTVGRERSFPRAVARLSVGEDTRLFLEPDVRALEFQTATIVRRLVLPRRPFLTVRVEVEARADGVPAAGPDAPPRGVIVELEAKIVANE